MAWDFSGRWGRRAKHSTAAGAVPAGFEAVQAYRRESSAPSKRARGSALLSSFSLKMREVERRKAQNKKRLPALNHGDFSHDHHTSPSDRSAFTLTVIQAANCA